MQAYFVYIPASYKSQFGITLASSVPGPITDLTDQMLEVLWLNIMEWLCPVPFSCWGLLSPVILLVF